MKAKLTLFCVSLASLFVVSCADQAAFDQNMKTFNAFGTALNGFYQASQPPVAPVVIEPTK